MPERFCKGRDFYKQEVASSPLHQVFETFQKWELLLKVRNKFFSSKIGLNKKGDSKYFHVLRVFFYWTCIQLCNQNGIIFMHTLEKILKNFP